MIRTVAALASLLLIINAGDGQAADVGGEGTARDADVGGEGTARDANARGEWTSVEIADRDLRIGDPADWRAYRQAEVEQITAPGGESAVRVTTSDPDYAGLAITISPRGGLGNRLRVELGGRVINGPPVTVHVGPNSWNQVGAVLSSPHWQPASFETGLLSDAPIVLHIAQPGPGGVFELGALRVSAQGAEPDVRRNLGPVNVAVTGHVGGDPTPLFAAEGEAQPSLAITDPPEGARLAWRFTAGAATGTTGALLRQTIGALPAGTRVRIEARCRLVTGGAGRIALLWRNEEQAGAGITATDWADLSVEAVLTEDTMPQWSLGAAEGAACELLVADPRVLVTLPDPTGAGVVGLPTERRPITFSMGDAKSIRITPPWPFMRPILAHLEYTSRWSYRFPDEHEIELSEAGDSLTLRWRFTDDPVGYTIALTADRADSALVEVRLSNAGAEPTATFVPGFCLQPTGAWSPRTFAYTIIPRSGEPMRLDLATPFEPSEEPWPRFGWARAHYAGSEAYQARRAAGEAWEPDPRRVREVGDFPLLARRVPGRDAWVAWVWPDVAGYFGNAAAPCMHMDPVLPGAGPGETVGMFGRMIFFEGTWEQLHEHARALRDELAGVSDLRPGAREE